VATIPVISSQSGSFTIASGSTSQAHALASTVTQANSFVVVSVSGGSNTIGTSQCAVALNAGGSTLTAYKKSTGAALIVNYTVIQFDSSVTVQHIFKNAVTLGDGYTETITSTDLTRSIIACSGGSNSGGALDIDDEMKLSFSSATEILYTMTAAYTVTPFLAYQVVQFPSSAVASVQTLDFTDSAASVDKVIATVDKDKSLIFATCTLSATTNSEHVYSPKFTSNTNVNFSRYTAGTSSSNIHAFIIEFTDYDVIHGDQIVTGLTATDSFLSTPTHPAAHINHVLETSWTAANDTDDDAGDACFRSSVSGTTATFTRAASTVNANLSWSLIDWGQTTAVNVSAETQLSSSTDYSSQLSGGASLSASTELSASNAYDSVISSGGSMLAATYSSASTEYSAAITAGGTVFSVTYNSSSTDFASAISSGAAVLATEYNSGSLDFSAAISTAGIVSSSTEYSALSGYDASAVAGAGYSAITEVSSSSYYDSTVSTTTIINAETEFSASSYYLSSVSSGGSVASLSEYSDSSYYAASVSAGVPITFIRSVELSGSYIDSASINGVYSAGASIGGVYVNSAILSSN